MVGSDARAEEAALRALLAANDPAALGRLYDRAAAETSVEQAFRALWRDRATALTDRLPPTARRLLLVYRAAAPE